MGCDLCCGEVGCGVGDGSLSESGFSGFKDLQDGACLARNLGGLGDRRGGGAGEKKRPPAGAGGRCLLYRSDLRRPDGRYSSGCFDGGGG